MRLKRQVCAALGQVAKHSVDLAETVVEAEVFPAILACLKDVDGFVRKHAATAIREVANTARARAAHRLQRRRRRAGGLRRGEREREPAARRHGARVHRRLLRDARHGGRGRGRHRAAVQRAVRGAGGPHQVRLRVVARADRQAHARPRQAMADAGALARLVAVGASRRSSDDLRSKCARALRFIIEKLTDLRALDRTPEEPGLPPEVCKFVVHQISKVLPNDPQGRHDFVASGGLAACQALDARASALKEYVDVIKSCYPEEIVRYYSPTYGTELLEKLEVTA